MQIASKSSHWILTESSAVGGISFQVTNERKIESESLPVPKEQLLTQSQ